MTKLSLEVLRDEKAPVLALLALVLKAYGKDAMDWQPEFLRAEIDRDNSVTISDLQSDKIQAGFILLQTDMFEAQHEVFETVCHLLNGTPCSFQDPTPLEAEELAAALAQYRLLVDGDDQRSPFSDEVKAYAGVVFHHYGMTVAPTIFQQALMPEFPEKADPSEKDRALSDIFDARTKAITDYVGSMTV